MKTNKKGETHYWKVVNIDKESNEITMLDYTFKHSDGFKGATGSKFVAVSKAQYKEQTSKENVIDRIIDSGLVEYKHNANIERKMAEVLYKEMKAAGEIESFCFDLSYREHWDELRSHGYPENKYPIFDCVGGGRCFDADFNGNVNPELSEEIRKFETSVKK